MSASIAINGFGPIGRAVLRRIVQHEHDLRVVLITAADPPQTCAELFEEDGVPGLDFGRVYYGDDYLVVSDRRVAVLAPADAYPWRLYTPDVVVETAGGFARAAAERHLAAGAGRVVVAGSSDELPTTVVGLNESSYDPARDRVVWAGSAVAACLAVLLDVLDRSFGVVSGLVTAFEAGRLDDDRTPDPSLLPDAPGAGAGDASSRTAIRRAVALLLPHLAGRVDGVCVGVPVRYASLVDLTARVERVPTAADVHDAFRRASRGGLGRLCAVSQAPTAAEEIRGNPRSAVVDGTRTRCTRWGGVKVLAWCDPEVSFASRVVDLCRAAVGATERSSAAPAAPASIAQPRSADLYRVPAAVGDDDDA